MSDLSLRWQDCEIIWNIYIWDQKWTS
jgi:hypothetical protein